MKQVSVQPRVLLERLRMAASAAQTRLRVLARTSSIPLPFHRRVKSICGRATRSMTPTVNPQLGRHYRGVRR